MAILPRRAPNKNRIPSQGVFTGLPLALTLALTTLGVCLYLVWGQNIWEMHRSKVLYSVLSAGTWGTVLPLQIVQYVAAVTTVHLALGFMAWLLAVASQRETPTTISRRYVAVAAWFAALLLWVLMANQAWFPASDFRSPWFDWVVAEWYGITWFALYSALLTGLVCAASAYGSFRYLRRMARPTLSFKMIAAFGAVAAVGWISLVGAHDKTPPEISGPPNVIIIGIDSLRCDLARGDGEESRTPSVDDFLAQAQRFSDATTPLARTFPAWVSILTGRHPTRTHARFNLLPRDAIKTGDTLGDVLMARGYHAVYSTDEVRFANIDETYGFDQLITPRIGASDFLLAKINDLPVSNLIASTRAGAWLFPNTHANRAAYVTYQPDDFTARLERELPSDRPLFLVTHLTLPHYPYAWAGQGKPTTPEGYRRGYREAVAEADQQFANVMDLLGRKGVLENAYVVVLSDHGEALGFPDDSLLRGYEDKMMIWNSLWGHGTSVLSPHQFQVLLAIRGYGRAESAVEPAIHDLPVSLEDLRPTLLELVGADPGQNLDGRSLRAILAGGPPSPAEPPRLRFTETGFNTPKILEGQYEEDGLLKEGARYYELDPDSARVRLRRDRIPELLEAKEYAVVGEEFLLASLPVRDGGARKFILARRDGRLAARITAAPDPAAHPEPARLWQALHERFAGEI